MLKKLTHWHIMLARMIAAGKTNWEITQVVEISDSYLSVLKREPLFRAEVERYQKMRDYAYRSAIQVLAENSVDVATELLDVALDPKTPAKIKADLCFKILDRIQDVSPVDEDEGGDKKLTYKQRMRMLKMNRATNPDLKQRILPEPKKSLPWSGSSTPPQSVLNLETSESR